MRVYDGTNDPVSASVIVEVVNIRQSCVSDGFQARKEEPDRWYGHCVAMLRRPNPLVSFLPPSPAQRSADSWREIRIYTYLHVPSAWRRLPIDQVYGVAFRASAGAPEE